MNALAYVLASNFMHLACPLGSNQMHIAPGCSGAPKERATYDRPVGPVEQNSADETRGDHGGAGRQLAGCVPGCRLLRLLRDAGAVSDHRHADLALWSGLRPGHGAAAVAL